MVCLTLIFPQIRGHSCMVLTPHNCIVTEAACSSKDIVHVVGRRSGSVKDVLNGCLQGGVR